MNLTKRIFCAVLAVLFLGNAGFAETVLTVLVKQIGQADRTVEFSMPDLESMQQHTLLTANEFVDGMQEFRGPLVRDILAAVDATDVETARLTAANDYTVEVSAAEFFRYDAVLALTMGGQQLSRRDKGPIWVMYPMSDHEELQDPVYNNRLIWQLVGMELE